MDWYSLGHAMWLVEAEGLRLLFDPLLEPSHHGGVFEVRPRRTIDATALRPDFILVSHRHGDHFDVPSLRRLAALDPDSVVLTPDELVAWAARALGFRSVRVIPPGQHVTLDRVRLVTTPSSAELEWGAVVETADAAAWNQVDTVPRDADQLCGWIHRALEALDRPGERLDLALVAWQPLLEIAAVTGGSTAFPLRRYRELLSHVAALSPRRAVPSACGSRHRGHAAWLEGHVYPVPEERFLADLARFAPTVEATPSCVGGRHRVGRGGVELDARAAASFVELHEDSAPHRFDPFEIPPLVDPDRGAAPLAEMRAAVDRWMHETLAPALAAAWPDLGAGAPLSCVADVAWPTARDAYTLRVSASGARVERGFDPTWDACNRVAGSLLFEVIEGRYPWSDVLLGGCLRVASRAYDVSEHTLRAARLGPVFFYHGLSYDESTRRSVVHAVTGASLMSIDSSN